mmetsp:Transcript_33962/g.86838  ORF Transcript_33962/g.86838 Transcript_33962/m.86838 type:complete len:401 (-) Transcript_33962:100-1302(-)|eukprot:jgi/Tetstr1/448345/TSEL_035628.t2
MSEGGNVDPRWQVGSRALEVAPFLVMDVMQAAAKKEAEGHSVLHFEVGQPSTGAPSKASEAAISSMRRGEQMGYTVAFGMPKLRAKISQYYKQKHGVDIPDSRICVTTGSSAAFLLSFMAAFNAGDKVAILRPGYPCYRNILRVVGVEAVEIPVGPETRFQPTRELLEKAGGSQLAGLLIASPANPTGSMLRPSELQDIISYCNENGIRFISDEIYHNITYGGKDASALEYDVDSQAIVINSFSKYWCMTGWRLGWMVLPPDLVRPVDKLAQNMYISAPTVSQIAAITAFDCDEELQKNLVRYAKNREVLLQELPKAGFKQLAPSDGAFYIYADVRDLTDHAGEFCKDMLQSTGVAATPGMDFDPEEGHHFVRFSYCGSEHDTVEAVKRLQEWMAAGAKK